MLQTLHISNIALIDEIEVTFGEGLNILSGETGAGKSIIIGSVSSLLQGQKITKDMLRDPQKPGLIELVFQVEEASLLQKLQQYDIEPEDGLLVISRKIIPSKASGSCRINGETVTTSQLREIADLLIDIHGQHEHQSLLKKSKHLELLDEYAQKDIFQLKKQLSQVYREYQSVMEQLEAMTMDEDQRLREIAFCEFEVNEIDAAALIDGEEEELTAAYKKASYSKQIVSGLSEIYEMTEGSSGPSFSPAISKAIRIMNQISEYDEGLSSLKSELLDMEGLLNDFCHDIQEYMSDISVDEAGLHDLQQRLDLIHDIKRKYGGSVSAVQQHRKESAEKLEFLQNYELQKNQLLTQQDQLVQQLQEMSDQLSCLRKTAAKKLEKELEEVLRELNFLTVKFEIVFETLNHFTAKGTDDVSFYISTNPGTPPKPLNQVASGGELSRVMLAVKSIMAQADDVDTVIFDEIDTGISGRTAQKVSELLHQMGMRRQVICISHLPQIVAMADIHFLIEKETEDASTQTQIYPLDYEASVREIARLLGGRTITDLVLENAREMKETAKA